MADPLILFDAVSRYYRVGGEVVKALDDVSLRLEVGEFVSVVGPSGSGKSTFMNLCGCLDTPTTGRVMIDGVDMAGMDDDQAAELRNARLGFVFQQFNLLPRTSALDNVSLPLLYAGCNRRVRHQAAQAALEQVGLGDRLKHQPSQLSGGQQQRVAIARALVNKPVLLLADEPTGALDTSTGAEIMALFQALNDAGISIILVTHETEVAQAAKRCLSFRDGKLMHDDALNQVRIAQRNGNAA